MTIRVGMVGLGKMGLSHVAIVRVHPKVQLVAGCDTMGHLTDVLEKHTGLKSPRDAIAYACGQPRIEAIVFGASSRANIQHTKRLIDELSC